MGNLNLGNLINNKNEILKAEIASMFALWDKANPEKINKANISIAHKKLSDWQSDLENIFIKLKNANEDIFKKFQVWNNFLRNWRSWRSFTNDNSYNYLLQILYGVSESLNSGIDKGSPKSDIKIEPENARWLSNAFGSYQKSIIYLDRDKEYIKNLINKIKSSLYYSNLNFENLKQIRDSLRELLSGLLSDDRFPINDVSLWDQAYMSASMFKAVLSQFFFNHLMNCWKNIKIILL